MRVRARRRHGPHESLRARAPEVRPPPGPGPEAPIGAASRVNATPPRLEQRRSSEGLAPGPDVSDARTPRAIGERSSTQSPSASSRASRGHLTSWPCAAARGLSRRRRDLRAATFVRPAYAHGPRAPAATRSSTAYRRPHAPVGSPSPRPRPAISAACGRPLSDAPVDPRPRRRWPIWARIRVAFAADSTPVRFRAVADEPQLRHALRLVDGLLAADVVAPRGRRADLDADQRQLHEPAALVQLGTRATDDEVRGVRIVRPEPHLRRAGTPRPGSPFRHASSAEPSMVCKRPWLNRGWLTTISPSMSSIRRGSASLIASNSSTVACSCRRRHGPHQSLGASAEVRPLRRAR